MVLMPTTSPLSFMSGPPLLPLFKAASVWIYEPFKWGAPTSRADRLGHDTMPVIDCRRESVRKKVLLLCKIVGRWAGRFAKSGTLAKKSLITNQWCAATGSYNICGTTSSTRHTILPRVTVKSSPTGHPTAISQSPECSLELSPNTALVSA